MASVFDDVPVYVLLVRHTTQVSSHCTLIDKLLLSNIKRVTISIKELLMGVQSYADDTTLILPSIRDLSIIT